MVSKLVCPFCDNVTDSREDYKTHLTVHVCLPYACERCDDLKYDAALNFTKSGGGCPQHQEKKFVDGADLPSIKQWLANYVDYMVGLNDFSYWKNCDFCSKLKESGRCVIEAEERPEFYENHARNHIYYFTSPAAVRDDDLKVTQNDTVVGRVSKLDDILGKMKSKFHRTRMSEKVTQILENGREHNNHSIEIVKSSPASDSDQIEELPRKEADDAYRFAGTKLEAFNRAKTLKVSLERLSQDVISKAKVMNDPDRIVFKTANKNKLPVFVEQPGLPPQIQVEESEAIILIPEVLYPLVDNSEDKYFCIFCLDNKEQYDIHTALAHYKEHLDYFPYKCRICSEVTINEYRMLEHFKKVHPDETSATVTITKLPATEDWLQQFFVAQRGGINTGKVVHRICVVCESTKRKVTNMQPISKSNDAFHQCLQHLAYSPFKCLKCEEKGQQYNFATPCVSSYMHIVNKHPEHIDLPLSSIYQRSRLVKPLDKFLSDYFKMKNKTFKFGMKMFIPIKYKEKLKEKIEEKVRKNLELSQRSQLANGVCPAKEPSLPAAFQPRSALDIVLQATAPMTATNLITSNVPAAAVVGAPLQGLQTYYLNGVGTSAQSFQILRPMSQFQTQNPIQYGSPLPQPIYSSPNIHQAQSASLAHTRIAPKPTHAYRMTVELTPETFDNELSYQTKKVLPDFNYFCIFCKTPTEFTSIIDATAHYAEHFNYKPVVCLLCSKKFSDVTAVEDHHKEIHEKLHPGSNLLYFINETEAIEKWVTDFLTSQKENKIWKEIVPSYMNTCLVCDKLLGGRKKPKYARKDVSVEHIYRHLNYKTFECIICKHEGTDRSFALIDDSALDHLKAHDLKIHDTNEAKRLFRKKFTIEQLEQLVEEHVTMLKYANCKRRAKDADDSDSEEAITLKQPKLSRPFTAPKPSTASKIDEASRITSTSVCCAHCHEIIPSFKALHQHNYTVHPSLSIASYSPKNILR